MVNFEPTEDQQMMRDSVAAFASEQVRPAARDADESGAIPEAIVQQAWELGLVQSSIPEEHGGFGGDRSAVTSVLVCEELAYGDLSMALHFLAPRLVTMPVLELGNAEQQKEILPAYTSETFNGGTAAIMEPSMGFDVNDLQLTATRQNGDFVLDGSKCYVPLGTDVRHMVVYARGADGTAAFVVPADTPGVRVVEREKIMGLKALATYELAFEGCRVPASAELAGDLAPIFNRSRVALACMAVGVAKAAFEYARDYAKDRRAFGVAIAQKQAIAFMLAEMAIEIDSSRLLAWEAAWKIDRGEDATREACMAKNYAADMALKVCDNAVQVLGGHGYIRDHMVELWLRNSRGFSIVEGLAIA
jgi:acyl-CoA dehydrogenase